ncbi:hypothetical protein KM043_008974 [Ampulex compressa]|nr:hypothetical protein KM043_008974 [Ampulex compressa]
MKCRRWKPRSLKEVFAPIQWLNWLMGRGTFEFPLGHPRPIFSMIYIASATFGYLGVLFWKLEFVQQNLPAYEKITYLLVLWTNVIVATWTTLIAFFTAKKFNRIIAKCGSIDSTLQAFGVDKNYEKALLDVIFRIVLWFIFLNILWLADMFWYDDESDIHKSVMTTILMYVPLVANAVVDLTFIMLMRDMYTYISTSRFGGKSENGSSRVKRIKVILSYDNKRSLMKHFVGTIRQLHLELIRVSADTNEAYGTQMLLEVAAHFIVITSSFCNMYFVNKYPSRTDDEKNNKILSMILWAFAQKTGGIVQELDSQCPDQETKDEIEQFSMQIILRPLYFTAYGFVRLNNDFTRTFFGTVTTYLVIVIQMSSTPNAIKSLIEVSS